MSAERRVPGFDLFHNGPSFRRLLVGCVLLLAVAAGPSIPESPGEDQVTSENRSTVSARERVLFDFNDPDELRRWRIVNDTVMGGRSVASIAPRSPGRAVFSGHLSLENSGGFATVRSPARDLKLRGFEGIGLRVRGDGRTYKLLVLPSDAWNQIESWQAPFDTVAGEWIEVKIPFAVLTRTIMGRRLLDAPPPDPASICSISFSIADKLEGPFALEMDWIKAYGKTDVETAMRSCPTCGA